jgi:ATP-binding cassette, subfamily F, member 3
MIKVEELSKSFGAQELFRDLSFTIAPGEKIGLVGRNGFGKTTLFQMLTGQMEPDSGEISVPKNYRVGYLEQQIHFTKDTVLQEACLGLREDAQINSWKVEKTLAGLGFTRADLQRHPQEFSGGFQIRLNLAKVLVSEPDLLLLDEPNNFLDILAIRWLVNFLKNWKKELLLITHDRLFMDEVTTHTMIIHRQRVRKVRGGTQKIYQQIAMEEAVHEKTRLNDEKKRKQLEVFISRFRAKARLGGLVQSRVKMLEKQERLQQLGKIEDLEFSFRYIDFPAAQMLGAHNLHFSYTGREPWLIDKISFDIGRRERIGVIGKNGKGKSTLLRIIAGELPLCGGTIKPHPVLRTAFFGQTGLGELSEQRTVFEEIMSADPDLLPQAARNICGSMMFGGDLALKPVGVLSGGERSRVLLGKLLATPSQLLLLDEPTNHLDLESCESLLEAIEEFPGSVMMVTHNELYLHRLATRLIVFDRGKVISFAGSYQEFLDKIGWESEEKEEKPLAVGRSHPANVGGQGAAKIKQEDKKTIKLKKAALVQERAKILKPLEQEISRLEAAINSLEKELHECTEALVEASGAGRGAEIASMSKRSHHLRPQIEAQYRQLDKILAQYENKAGEYKERMLKLEGGGS